MRLSGGTRAPLLMSLTGTVKFYREEQAFGFICPADGGADLFVHKNDIVDGKLLVEGDWVRSSETLVI